MKKMAFMILSFALICIPSCKSASTRSAEDRDAVFRKMAVKLSSIENRLANKTVAVYGFEVIGRPGDNFAKYATEKLTHAMVDTGRLQVVERSRIDEILKEQQFTLSGVVDANMAARIGKILAVDAVIIGTINVTGNESEFISRAIQSERAIILASANERIRIETAQQSERITTGRIVAKDATVDNDVVTGSDTTVIFKSAKTVYVSGETITVNYSGMSGSQYDWITLVEASEPDTSYGEWFYSYGKTAGTHTFNAVGSGIYEVRAYFDWPNGGYVVKQRLKITVK